MISIEETVWYKKLREQEPNLTIPPDMEMSIWSQFSVMENFPDEESRKQAEERVMQGVYMACLYIAMRYGGQLPPDMVDGK